jgi:hypothetical protein
MSLPRRGNLLKTGELLRRTERGSQHLHPIFELLGNS